MTKRDKNWVDEVFSKGLSGHKLSPPAEIWEGIQSGLNAKKKRRLLPVYFRVAATLGILTLIGLGYYYTGRTGNPGMGLNSSSGPERVTADTAGSGNTTVLPDQNTGGPVKDIKRIKEPGASDTGEKPLPKKEGGMREQKPSAVEKSAPPLLRIKITRETRLPLPVSPRKAGMDSIPGRSFAAKEYTWEDLRPESGLVTDAEEENRISIAAMLSPIYSYRSLSDKNSELSQYLSEVESGKISYSGGLELGYRASDRLSVHTGLVYARMGIGVSEVYTTYDRNAYVDDFMQVPGNTEALIVSNSTGFIRENQAEMDRQFISSNSTNKLSIEDGRPVFTEEYTEITANSPDLALTGGTVDQFFHFLEIPFMLRYKIIDRKTDLRVLGGISTNFLLGSRVYYLEGGDSREIGTVDDLRTVNYSGNIGFGLDMELSKTLEFLFEPQVKYYLNSINGPENFVESRPYSFGLYTGFRYRF